MGGGYLDPQTHAEGGHHVKMTTEIRVMHLQPGNAKGCQQSPSSWGRCQEQVLPCTFPTEPTLPKPWFPLPASRTGGQYISVVWGTPSVVLCYKSPSKLTGWPPKGLFLHPGICTYISRRAEELRAQGLEPDRTRCDFQLSHFLTVWF